MDHHDAINPTGQALKALASSPKTGPFVMLNLLKFKPEGGASTYQRYGDAVSPMIERLGGRVVYFGRCADLLVGSEEWDAILLVRYPSRRAFLDMIASPEYQAAHVDRDQSLVRAVLYATDPVHGRLDQ